MKINSNLTNTSDLLSKQSKKFQKLSIAAVISSSLALFAMSAAAVGSVDIESQSNLGYPTMMTGQLGAIKMSAPSQSLKNILSTQPAYAVNGNESFLITHEWSDSLGKSHTRFDQTINGIKVYGTSMIMHANPSQNNVNSLVPTSRVYAVSGTLAKASLPYKSISMMKKRDRGMSAYRVALNIGKVHGRPELAYVYLPETEQTKLSWKIEVEYNSKNGFEYDEIFFDVSSNEILTQHPQVHRAKRLNTHDMQNRSESSCFAPGKLLCTTNQSDCGGDASAKRAHRGASQVYDYFANTFGRDSINDRGMTIVSSVHTGNKLNNAFFFKNQMFYGDGDGQVLSDLTGSYDVIAHELTHGVTSFTAGLVYRNESGALNEAMSDIFGISAEAHRSGRSVPDWKIGSEVYLQGEALRFMDNPTKDGQSEDFYPERFTGSQDNGGVHLNSGIGNLAYVLLVQGGKHPRGKTNIQVAGVGLLKAEKIFYRALTTYFSRSTTFAQAKSGTEQAAQDLFGSSAKQQVSLAWCAVGVGSCSNFSGNSGGGNSGGDNSGNTLANGESKSNINISKGQSVLFTMNVPSGARNVKFEIGGGSGDADLYVKRGSAPTDNSFDCRPFKTGNSEICTVSSSGKYFIKIKAFETVRNLKVRGGFTR